MLQRGEDALKEEIESVEIALKDTSKEDKEYVKLIARRNIAYQFERFDWNHTVISLNQYNFDYVLRNHNVLVKFFMPWCSYSQSFAPIFVGKEGRNDRQEEVAKEVNDVVLAEVNLEDYPVFAVGEWKRNEEQTRYHISAYPTLKWFSKDGEKRLPIDVDVERTKEALVQYCEDMTKEHEESEL